MEWSSLLGETIGAGRGLPTHSQSALRPTELLIYVLWREILSQCQELELLVIKDLPLMPVVAGDARVLMTTSIAPLLLCTKGTTTQQENRRAQLRREAGRLQALVAREGENVAARMKRISGRDLLEDLSVGRLEPSISVPQVAFPSSTSTAVNVSDVEVEVSGGLAHDEHERSTEERVEIMIDSFSSVLLGDVLHTLRVPVIDGAIFEEPPSVVTAASTLRTGQPQNFPTSGHKILACISHIHMENMVLHTVSVESEGSSRSEQMMVESGPLLRFDLLSVEQRKSLLLEFLSAHRARALSEAEIANLKALPLFTARDGKAIAVADCNGVYWCDSVAALAGLSDSYADASHDVAAASPVILLTDNDLRPVYTLVGAEELTPATVVRKFTLPSLGRMGGVDRLRVMRGLAAQWDTYRNDTDLIELLKGVAFVPAWYAIPESDIDATTTTEILDMEKPFRRPQDLFSWTNSDLLAALHGPYQNEYFAPPSIRYAH